MKPFLFILAFLVSLPATGSEEILVIGDSHTYGMFGKTLDTLLRSPSENSVVTVGWHPL